MAQKCDERNRVTDIVDIKWYICLTNIPFFDMLYFKGFWPEISPYH